MEPDKLLHYSTVEKVGEGLNGSVYRAWDTKQNRTVAMKIISDDVKGTTFHRARQRLRAQIGIDHPNLASINMVDEVNGQAFIISEFVEGTSLKQLLLENGIARQALLPIVEQICLGLERLHKEGIVHGNLRPSNIMITSDGKVKLLDAGLSVLTDFQSRPDFHLPYDPLHYLSPEQIKGGNVDFRSDHFALGVILYRCVTGEMPFTGTDKESLMNAILTGQLDCQKLRASLLAGDSILLIEKLLSKSPADRFTTTERLKVTVSEMISFEKDSGALRFRSKARQNPRLYLLISLITVLLIIVWYAISTPR